MSVLWLLIIEKISNMLLAATFDVVTSAVIELDKLDGLLVFLSL